MSKLSFEDAVDIWIRWWRGQYQHVIAAVYGVNQGRINEVLKGKLFPGSEMIARHKRTD